MGSRPISRVLSRTVIHLGRLSPNASSNLPGSSVGHAKRIPIWSCSRWGLPCHYCYQQRGALLPHHFTLTPCLLQLRGGIFSVALAVGLRRPGVTWHPALWSPDFPPRWNANCNPAEQLSGRLPIRSIEHLKRQFKSVRWLFSFVGP